MTVENVDNKEQGAQTPDYAALIEALQNDVAKLKEENVVLKGFADKTIQEKRDLKAKHDQENAEREKQLEEKVNRTKEENEQLYKQYKDQNAALLEQINNYKQNEYNNKVEAKARELAAKLEPLNEVAAKTLTKEFKNRIKLDEDGTIKVLDDMGNVTISQVDQLVTEFGTNYAFMLKGVNSTGGGSHSSTTAAPQKKFSEMNESERRDLYVKDVTKYRELKSQDL